MDCIVWVDTEQTYEDACHRLTKVDVIGLDCEWPSFKGGAAQISVLQLATRQMVFLFDVSLLLKILKPHKWDTLGSLFTSSHIEKVGYGLLGDLDLLRGTIAPLKKYLVAENNRNCIDLHTVVDRLETLNPQLLRDKNSVDIEKVTGGLSGVTALSLGKPLDKAQQRLALSLSNSKGNY